MHRTIGTRALGRFLVIVLALTPAALIPPYSQAASSTSVTSSDGVRYDSCRNHPYRYTIDTAGDWASWDAEVVLHDPEGSRSDSDFLYDGDPAAGRGAFFICGFEPAGRWRLSVNVTYYDDYYRKTGTDSASTTFVLRKPRTRTAYTARTARQRPSKVLRFKILSRIERPAGYAPNRFEYVVLESRQGGAWKRVKGTRTYTNGNGVAAMRVRKDTRGAVAVRAVTLNNPDFVASRSKSKRIR